MVHRIGDMYPGVEGKVVEFAEHSFVKGRLFIRVRFQDQTELLWQVECALTLRVAQLSDWKTGDCEHIKTFTTDEQDREL